MSVLVAGAGPTGLIASRALADRGHDVLLIDQAPAVGGMSSSFEIGGQSVDFGSHRLHGRADPKLLGELRELLGEDLQRRDRNGRIRLLGRWVAFPLQFRDLLNGLPRWFAVRAALDAALSPFRRAKGTNFAQDVRAGLGPTVFDAFYAPYAKKLWGLPAEEIDASMAKRRVSAGGPLDILRRLVSVRSEEGKSFYYPRLGYGQIIDAIADSATRSGVEICLSTRLDALTCTEDGVDAVFCGPNGFETRRFSTCVSTVAVQHLVDAAMPAVPSEVADAASRLDHRGMLLVYLVIPRPQYTPFDAHYFPGQDILVARLSEPKNYRDGDDPAESTVLCAEIPCDEGGDLWRMNSESLGGLVSRQLVEQGLPVTGHVATEVRRLPCVYPKYRHGYQDDLDCIEAWVDEQPRLVTVGRLGLFVPDNLHHVIEMGNAVARVVNSDGNVDREAWRLRREEFRSNVVED